MGTRSLTFVYDDSGSKPILNLYRQFDGYPGGHGRELALFLNSIEAVTNGISQGEQRRTANGMGCLAAQLVAHFKNTVGGFYIHPVTDTDCGQDYEYHVRNGRVMVTNWRSEVIFTGTWEDLYGFCSEEELA